jgi:hypothetical protein
MIDAVSWLIFSFQMFRGLCSTISRDSLQYTDRLLLSANIKRAVLKLTVWQIKAGLFET